MKRYAWMILALGMGLALPGCILTSGQIQIHFDLDTVNAIAETNITGETVDLNTEQEYADNKDKLKGLTDVAVLGQFTNLGSSAINVEVWMTPGTTSYTTDAQLKADATAKKVWGPFSLGASGSSTATQIVDWNESAALFSQAGKDALLAEAKGDGIFTLYAIAAAGSYSFSITKGVIVLVMDVGV